MDKRIWKFGLGRVQVDGEVTTWLACGVQRGEIRVWAEVDVEAGPHVYKIVPFATGEQAPMGTDWQYIGTQLLQGGGLVAHVYAREVR